MLFSKNHFVSLILCISFVYLFIPAPSPFRDFFLSSRAFRCSIKSVVWDLHSVHLSMFSFPQYHVLKRATLYFKRSLKLFLFLFIKMWFFMMILHFLPTLWIKTTLYLILSVILEALINIRVPQKEKKNFHWMYFFRYLKPNIMTTYFNTFNSSTDFPVFAFVTLPMVRYLTVIILNTFWSSH